MNRKGFLTQQYLTKKKRLENFYQDLKTEGLPTESIESELSDLQNKRHVRKYHKQVQKRHIQSKNDQSISYSHTGRENDEKVRSYERFEKSLNDEKNQSVIAKAYREHQENIIEQKKISKEKKMKKKLRSQKRRDKLMKNKKGQPQMKYQIQSMLESIIKDNKR